MADRDLDSGEEVTRACIRERVDRSTVGKHSEVLARSPRALARRPMRVQDLLLDRKAYSFADGSHRGQRRVRLVDPRKVQLRFDRELQVSFRRSQIALLVLGHS